VIAASAIVIASTLWRTRVLPAARSALGPGRTGAPVSISSARENSEPHVDWPAE